jgi:hypothetical protein
MPLLGYIVERFFYVSRILVVWLTASQTENSPMVVIYFRMGRVNTYNTTAHYLHQLMSEVYDCRQHQVYHESSQSLGLIYRFMWSLQDTSLHTNSTIKNVVA